jgi:hypothetical protein
VVRISPAQVNLGYCICWPKFSAWPSVDCLLWTSLFGQIFSQLERQAEVSLNFAQWKYLTIHSIPDTFNNQQGCSFFLILTDCKNEVTPIIQLPSLVTKGWNQWSIFLNSLAALYQSRKWFGTLSKNRHTLQILDPASMMR